MLQPTSASVRAPNLRDLMRSGRDVGSRKPPPLQRRYGPALPRPREPQAAPGRRAAPRRRQRGLRDRHSLEAPRARAPWEAMRLRSGWVRGGMRSDWTVERLAIANRSAHARNATARPPRHATIAKARVSVPDAPMQHRRRPCERGSSSNAGRGLHAPGDEVAWSDACDEIHKCIACPPIKHVTLEAVRCWRRGAVSCAHPHSAALFGGGYMITAHARHKFIGEQPPLSSHLGVATSRCVCRCTRRLDPSSDQGTRHAAALQARFKNLATQSGGGPGREGPLPVSRYTSAGLSSPPTCLNSNPPL